MNDSTPEAWKLLFGEPDKATNLKEVAAKVGVSLAAPTPVAKPDAAAAKKDSD